MSARFGAYEILYELKSGGMGAVLLARRRGPGAFEQLVAIKTIRPEHANTPAVRSMFLDEARILAGLNHPGVATVHDFGEEGGTLYMAMEYVAGIPFRDLGEMKPPPIVIVRAIVEACRGLHAAHELRDLTGNLMGLVHRDISPDNLLVGYDGHVKVIDFGIALVKNRQAPVTEFGMLKGKPPYMSPEQVKNESMDRRSDVFSLAVVLWELLVGKPLFDGDSIYAVAYAVENQVIVPPSRAIGEDLPLGLDAAVMNALDRDPERRTPTAAAFAEQLEQVLQASGGETLEAWAEHALKAQREANRAWLAQVVAGAGDKAMPGRATGAITELAPLGSAATAHAPISAVRPIGAQTDGSPQTSIGREHAGGDDSQSLPPRNRLAPLAILLLLLLGGGIAVYVVLHRHDEPVAPHDAATVAVDAPGPADATRRVDAAELVTPADAGVVDAVPADAGRHHPTDAGHGHHDATPVIAVAVDAGIPAPVGTGFVTITTKPGGPFLQILIDSDSPVPTPMIHHKISAGHHTIKLLDAKTGEVVDSQAIDVVDGKTVVVTQH